MKIGYIILIIILTLLVLFIVEYLILTKINFHKINHPEFYKGKDFTFKKNKNRQVSKHIKLGNSIANQSTIVFCGLARNIDNIIIREDILKIIE